MATQLRGRRGVVLDTMVGIYLFEDQPRYGALCEELIALAGRGVFGGVVTPVTAAEVLVKPLREARPDLADAYRAALAAQPNIELAKLDAQTGFVAGALRAAYALPLPDLLQMAVALQSSRPTLVTNDKALARVGDVDVFLLENWL